MAVCQVMRYESVNVKESAGLDPAALSPANPREKWLRKRTQVKLRVCACWGHILFGRCGFPGGWGIHMAGKALDLPLRAEYSYILGFMLR